ncbi:MAG: glycosyltransferase family 39 protein [Magnetococcales bacterium]|nr:glycosyltransferase family 39 protein [Magnetococcales bacterium]
MIPTRRLRIDLLLILGTTGLVALVLYARTLTTHEWREWLIRWSGDFLGVNATLILLTGILESETIRGQLHHLLPSRRLWILPALLIGGTLYTALIAPQTHRIFYDETIYLSIGQNLAHLNRAQTCHSGGESHGRMVCEQGEYNKQPNGYPFLTSLVFRLFGTSERAAFHLNNLLLGCAAVVVLLLVFPLGGGWQAGVFAAWMVILNPQNLHWFNTTAAEPASALTVALAMLAAFHFRRTDSTPALTLLTALTAFALHFRPESLLLLPLVALVALPTALTRPRRLLAHLLFFVCLTLPLWLHMALFHNHPWGSSGQPFSLSYFFDNLAVNGWHYLDNQAFPPLFTGLAILGLFRPGDRLRERGVIGLWFLLFWGVFLFFYAGSYHYGADIRYALLSALPLAILAGLGAETLWKEILRHATPNPAIATALVTALLWCAHWPFLPLVRATTDEAWAARADLHYARLLADRLPPDSLVLTHNPNLFQLWGHHAAQLSLAQSNPDHVNRVLFPRYRGGIFLHHNFWCNVPDTLQNSFCDQAYQKFQTEWIAEYPEKNYRFALYRLRLKTAPPAPSKPD